MADPDYFTIDEFRNLADMDDTDAYPDASVEDAAAFFTAIVEREIGYPLVPRTFTVTTDGTGVEGLRLPHPFVRSVTSVTVDGGGVNPSLLTVNNGLLRYRDWTLWTTTSAGNVTVTYVAGNFDECPRDVKSAVMWAVRDRVVSQSSDSTQDPRQTSMTNDLGGTNQYVLPGEKRPTGYPELDAVIASYKRQSYYGSLSIG